MDAVFCTPPVVRHGAPSSRTAPARRPRVGTAPCGGGSPPPGATDRDVAGAYEQVFQAALETPERRPFPIEKAEAAVGKALGSSAIYDAYLDAIAERAADLQGDG
ncbi:hypothetical protein GGP51_001520 [Salinibacter ruber]|uniref:hypothetical protein n=1 Tax=Salinibacter ruber TaxID=146919 RepID=UPI0013C3298C|nr:hypothetical protein [Salinibacter ruber]MCS3823450.1 hypothetical protein [Salinibacter ruber]MCS4190046.1 hypothetical protein [Salinibacter ruber]